MAYPNTPERLEELDDSLKEHEMFYKLGLATAEELQEFAELIEELRNTPPREWPEGTTLDEAFEIAAAECREAEHQRATTRKRRDLIEEARSQRGASV